MSQLMVDQVQPVIVQVGDIAVTQSQVFTPNGCVPLKGSIFVAMDVHTYGSKTPGWAIVLAILLFPIGLLFLFAKEPVIQGYVNVSVQNPTTGIFHTTQVPALNWQNMDGIMKRVAYMQTLAQWANANS